MRNTFNVINQCVIISALHVNLLLSITSLCGCIRWRSGYGNVWLTSYIQWTNCIWHQLSIGVFSDFTETGTGIRGPLLHPITLFILMTFSVTSFPSPATRSRLPPWPSRVLWPHPSYCLPPCQLSDPTETLNPWDFFLPVDPFFLLIFSSSRKDSSHSPENKG